MSRPKPGQDHEAEQAPLDAGAPDDASESELTDLLVRCDERLASGEPLSTDLLDEEPSQQVSPQFQKGLACLRLLDRLRPGRGDEANDAISPESFADSSWRHGDPTRIGRFQIRRKLGHGGFGVVYLAHDPKLRRLVALKVPHPRTLLTNELRERFQLEAAAAAALDHPNVVPVFDSGETGPICYIASAYCPGISLAAWLRNRTEPIPARSAAALIAQIADGVHHAHERGILHRDLKPANVLLTPLRAGKPIEDSPTLDLSTTLAIDPIDYQPRITDFGMAKRVGEWESNGAINEDPAAPLTKTGAVMGTPSYMAPEQAAGRNKDIGVQTDVHGIGILLYEILTGQPPFLAESTYDILRRVQNDEPLSPRHLRPKLPRDLETICLKCLQKEPRRRYASAKELADDLRNFLEGRSIRARSVGPIERTWRWSLREPVIAGLLATLIVVVTSAIAGLSLLFVDARNKATLASQSAAIARESERLARAGEAAANTAREAEKTARAKVEEHLIQVRSLMDNLTSVTQVLSVTDPNQRKLRRSLLEDLLAFHEIFITEKGNDPAVLYESAMAYQKIAQLRVELGRIDPAQQAFERSRELFLRIGQLDPTTPRYRLSRAWGGYWHGFMLLRRKGMIKDAVVLYEDSIRTLDGLLKESPNDRSYQSALAVITLNWAGTQSSQGKPEEAENGYSRVITLLRRLIKAAPRMQGYRSDLAVALDSLAILLMDKRFGSDRPTLRDQAIGMGSLALLNATGRQALLAKSYEDRANRAIREAVAIARSLVKQTPNSTTFRYTLTRVQNRLAQFSLQAKARDEAFTLLRSSVETMKQVLTLNEDVVDHRVMLISTASLLARELPNESRDEAIALLTLCLTQYERLVSQFPDSIGYKRRQASTLYAYINRLMPDRLPEGITYLDGLIKRQPNHAIAVNDLAISLATRQGVSFIDRARVLDLVRRSILAPTISMDALHREGVDLYRKGSYRDAKNTFVKCTKQRSRPAAEDYLYLTMTCWKLGERDQARDHYDTALRILKTVRTVTPELRQLRTETDEIMAAKPSL